MTRGDSLAATVKVFRTLPADWNTDTRGCRPGASATMKSPVSATSNDVGRRRRPNSYPISTSGVTAVRAASMAYTRWRRRSNTSAVPSGRTAKPDACSNSPARNGGMPPVDRSVSTRVAAASDVLPGHARQDREQAEKGAARGARLQGISTTRACEWRPAHRRTAGGFPPRDPGSTPPACPSPPHATPARRGDRRSAPPRRRRSRPPNPAVSVSSWATTIRLVSRTAVPIVSQSQGAIVRRSITRTLSPSFSACCAASSERCTSAPQVTTVRSVPSRRTAARPNGMV